MGMDRFGNQHAPDLSYARGKILTSTADDFRKLQHAWHLVREHGAKSVYIFTGLEHSLPMQQEDLLFADDEIGPALHFDRLKSLALEHLGGSADKHDVAPFNQLTGATMATHLTLVKTRRCRDRRLCEPQPSFRSRGQQPVPGARFTDTAGLSSFKEALSGEQKVTLVVLTRLAVTYELLPVADINTIVRLSHEKGAIVYIDDAGGARVGPAAFDQPRMLELGVDVGATGLDKYGTVRPRIRPPRRA